MPLKNTKEFAILMYCVSKGGICFLPLVYVWNYKIEMYDSVALCLICFGYEAASYINIDQYTCIELVRCGKSKEANCICLTCENPGLFSRAKEVWMSLRLLFESFGFMDVQILLIPLENKIYTELSWIMTLVFCIFLLLK